MFTTGERPDVGDKAGERPDVEDEAGTHGPVRTLRTLSSHVSYPEKVGCGVVPSQCACLVDGMRHFRVLDALHMICASEII